MAYVGTNDCMGLQDIIDAAEAVSNYDEIRRSTFCEELEVCKTDEMESFPRTWSVVADEREALKKLSEELNAEEENINELIERTEFLSVEQAIRHRNQTIEKLEAHNVHLWEFHDAMATALDRIETNLSKLESNNSKALEDDPEPQLERAQDALKAHNKAIKDLDTNLTILNAYLQ